MTPSRALGRLRWRPATTMIALIAVWCALWGNVSIANLLSGAVVALGVVFMGGRGDRRADGAVSSGGLRPRPMARFVGLVAVDLVRSTITVARQILRWTNDTEEAIIAVTVPIEATDHLMLMNLAITVTPGTAVVDADRSSGTLFLHLLQPDRREQVERHTRELASLLCQALPAAPDRAAEEEPPC